MLPRRDSRAQCIADVAVSDIGQQIPALENLSGCSGYISSDLGKEVTAKKWKSGFTTPISSPNKSSMSIEH